MTALIALVTALAVATSGHAVENPAGVAVTVDRVQISTTLGGKFTFRSTTTNNGSTDASGLIAHLNVLSLKDGVYVDPEDWSANRTRYLDPIPPGGSITTTWRIQAVNDGDFGVYVAVLPDTGAPRPPTTGPTIHLAVAGRKTLNAGGIVPVALGVPALLGLLALGLWIRRRR
jgi:peptidoglycan hydrolase-like protein with peptidoglycan-binding domain